MFYKKYILNYLFSLFISTIISLLLNKIIIYIFKKNKIFQIIRKEGPKIHFLKKNTPTMGGISIIITNLVYYLFFLNKNNIYLNSIIIIFVLTGILGFYDDFIKVFKKKPKGLSIKNKIILQYLIYNIIIIINKNLLLKKNFFIFNSGFNYIINYFLYYLIIMGCCNAVNFTDGLDGLVSFPLILLFLLSGIITSIYSNFFICNVLNLNFNIIYKEISLLCFSFIGAILGFLWYNSYPATIFLGDTGSLSLGAVLGLIFVLIEKKILLFLSGFLLLIEFMSVLIQIITYNFFNKYRIFLMAPIHHHFELQNINENKIVIRFYIISLILFFLSLIFIL